jgi:hypothetical protein
MLRSAPHSRRALHRVRYTAQAEAKIKTGPEAPFNSPAVRPNLT